MAKQTVDNRKLQDAIGVKIERIQKGFYESYEREARNILMAIAQEGVKKIKEYIKKYFYDETSESPYYERLAEQGGFLATISYTIIDKHGMPNQIRIYCDWDKLKRVIRPYSPGQTPQFDAHNGFDNKKFTEGLYDYIMDGTWNSPYGNPRTDGIGEGVNEELSQLLTGRARQEIAAYMKKYFKDTTIKHRVAGGLSVSKDTRRHK
nr:MAG TPA: hypothetical protein [Caudoviricetes sp.]